jgi:hypothetical protein
MKRMLLMMTALLLASAWRPALAQELQGEFTNPNSGETFRLESNGDGTSELYGSDGRHVGTAEDNGDGTWDINNQSGNHLGNIDDNGDGSFDVHGSDGGNWGSGESDE